MTEEFNKELHTKDRLSSDPLIYSEGRTQTHYRAKPEP